MRRLLAILLAVVGLSLISPPANAAVSVTITASPTTLVEGGSTVIKGKAVNAKPGSVVRLQLWSGGSWQTLASKKVWSTQTYAFKVTPPRGSPQYRVFKPAQLGQKAAVSAVVRLTVTWQPTLTLATAAVHDTSNHQFIHVSGHTNAPNTVVRMQKQAGSGEWRAWGSVTTAADGSYLGDMPNLSRGSIVRAAIVASGARLQGLSPYASTGLEPFDLILDGPKLTVWSIPYGANEGAVVHFDAETGDVLSFEWQDPQVSGPYDPVSFKLIGPNGAMLTGQLHQNYGGDATPYYEAPASGTYSILLMGRQDTPDELAEVTITGSRQKEYDAAIDGGPVTVSSSRPWQVADVHFTGTTNQVVSLTPPAVACPNPALYLGDAEIPMMFAPSHFLGRTFRLPSNGTYTVRLFPCSTSGFTSDLQVLSAREATMRVDDATPAVLDLDLPARVGVVSVDATDGQDIRLVGRSDGSIAYARLYAPDGTFSLSLSTGEGVEFVADQTGTYQMWTQPEPGSAARHISWWASTPRYVDVTPNGDKVDLGPIPGQKIVMAFHASAGDYVTLYTKFTDSSGCSSYSSVTDSSGQAVRTHGPTDIYPIPADGDYRGEIYPCVDASGSVGVASSTGFTIASGETKTVSIANPSGLGIVLVPGGPNVLVTVSDAAVTGTGSYRGGLYTASGGYATSFSSTTSTEPQYLGSYDNSEGSVVYLRSDDPDATGSFTVSVTPK